ncbi:hypothetical protein [Botrytis cinerea umbra-like virus 1]|nr:hypothetical protein [Botrytis cinerea umbra-like virus 1]
MALIEYEQPPTTQPPTSRIDMESIKEVFRYKEPSIQWMPGCLPSSQVADGTWNQEVSGTQFMQRFDGAWTACTAVLGAANMPRPVARVVVKGEEHVRVPGPLIGDRWESAVDGAISWLAQAPGKIIDLASGYRLRRRGRLTRMLEGAAKGFVGKEYAESGGKTSSDAVSTWLSIIASEGVKLQAVQRVICQEGQGAAGVETRRVEDVALTVQVRGETLLVSVGLLSKLSIAALYRPRTTDVMLALKSKAVQEASSLGLTNTYTATVLPGTVAVAMLVSKQEWASYGALAGSAGQYSKWQSTHLRDGSIPNVFSAFWRRNTQYSIWQSYGGMSLLRTKA